MGNTSRIFLYTTIFFLMPFIGLAQKDSASDTLLIVFVKKPDSCSGSYDHKTFKIKDKVKYKTEYKTGYGSICHIGRHWIIIDHDTLFYQEIVSLSGQSPSGGMMPGVHPPAPGNPFPKPGGAVPQNGREVLARMIGCNPETGFIVTPGNETRKVEDSLEVLRIEALEEYSEYLLKKESKKDSLTFIRNYSADLKYRDNLRVDPLMIAFTGFGVGYEHRFDRHNSIMVMSSFTVFPGEIPFFMHLAGGMAIYPYVYPYNSIGVHAEYRYYFGNKNFYLAPCMIYRYVFHRRLALDFDYHEVEVNSEKANVLGVGFMMGRQFSGQKHKRFLTNIYGGLSLKWRYSHTIFYGITGYNYDWQLYPQDPPSEYIDSKFFVSVHFGVNLGWRFKSKTQQEL